MTTSPPSRWAGRLSRDPALLLAAVLALSGLGASWSLGRRSPGLDFYQFWVVAQVAGRGDVPNVYAEEARYRLAGEFRRRAQTDEDSERRRVAAQPWKVFEPTATPLLYSAFRPLSGGSYEHDFLLFRLIGLAAFTTGVLALARRLGHGLTVALLFVAFAGLACQPLESDIRVGNVNQLQVGLIAGYLWLSSRKDASRWQWAAGALLALLVLFKPNLIALVPLLAASWILGRRRQKLARQSVGMAAGAAAGVAAPALVFGTWQAWPQWLAYLRSLPPEKIPLRYGNMGLARQVLETLEVDLAPLLALATTAIVLACLWLGRRHGPVPAAIEDGAAIAAGCLVYLLSAPMVWLHYLLLALPAAVVLLRPGDGATVAAWRRVPAVVALLAIGVNPWADPFGIQDLRVQAAVTSLGVLVLFALVCVDLSRGLSAPRGGAAAGVVSAS